MRVLVVHNRYSSRVPSGENLAVDDEVRWLRAAGVEVETHEVTNDDVFGASPIDRARHAAESIWSPSAKRRMAAAIDHLHPDLVHIHNLFPLLTASVPSAALRGGVPVVWTVHNLRLTCAAGTHFREGQPCQLCRPGWRLSGVRYACYGDSVAASGLITAATALFGRLARRGVTALAISKSLERWLVDRAGFAAGQVQVKYNGVAPPAVATALQPPAARRSFLFAAHLMAHKGVALLLEAWRRAALAGDAALVIAGDGPLAGEVRAAAANDSRVRWLGPVPMTEMANHLATARAVIVPSTWDEPFGRTAAEALAYGRPVITTGTGGLSEIVDHRAGWITGVDPGRLAKAIVQASESDEEVEQRGRAAERRHLQLFSPEATTEALMGIYDDVLRRSANRTARSRSSDGGTDASAAS